MARFAERLQITERVRSTVRKRCDVIYFGGWGGVAISLAVDAEGRVGQLHPPDATPTGIVAALGCCAAVGVDALVALLLV